MLAKTDAGKKQDRIWRKQNEGTWAGVVEIGTRKTLLAVGETRLYYILAYYRL